MGRYRVDTNNERRYTLATEVLKVSQSWFVWLFTRVNSVKRSATIPIVVVAAVFGPALAIARQEPRNVRIGCARTGMVQVLADFRTDSYTCWANRKADGLGGIDHAANTLNQNWQANGGASVANDVAMTALLNACAGWLTNRKVFGMRVTGWREAPIQRLYWQAAWCYSCDNYIQQALLQVAANNGGGHGTAVSAVVPMAATGGNPYHFVNCDYMHDQLNQPPRVLRGDTRGPVTIQNNGGFQARNLANRWQYAPWFDGHATGDTISITTDEALAINAVGAAHATGMASPAGPLPPWLAGSIAAVAPLGAAVRGFVYHFGNLGNLRGTRVSQQQVGRENIYLALPDASITQFWAVLLNRHTVGPFPFPPGAGPPPVVNYSGAQLQLA